ncbi:hypothetical protein JMUB7551_28710 [Staphylococcus aureus]
MIRRPPRSTPLYSSAASDVYKRQDIDEAITHFKEAVTIDPKHLLSQHALKTFTKMKEEE